MGCKKTIKTLQGNVKVEIPFGTQNGDKEKLRGKGIDDEKYGKKGDTYLIYNIIIPTKVFITYTFDEKYLFTSLLNKDLTTLDDFNSLNSQSFDLYVSLSLLFILLKLLANKYINKTVGINDIKEWLEHE